MPAAKPAKPAKTEQPAPESSFVAKARTTPEVVEIKARVVSITETLPTLLVTDADSYAAVGEFLQGVKLAAKDLLERRLKITRPIDEAKAQTMDLFAPDFESLTTAETTLKARLIAYDDAQARERARLQSIADEEARKERVRLQNEANEKQRKADEKAADERRQAQAKRDESERQERIAQQARDKAAAEQKAADEAKAAGDRKAQRDAELAAQKSRDAAAAAERERDAAASKATKLDEKAEATVERASDAVAVLHTAAAQVVAQVVEPERVAVKGLKRLTTWKHRVVDAAKVPRLYLMIDDAKIAKIVKALGAEHGIDGVEAYEESGLAAGAK